MEMKETDTIVVLFEKVIFAYMTIRFASVLKPIIQLFQLG